MTAGQEPGAIERKAAGGDLLATIHRGVAAVTLNRPASLNALTLAMLEALSAWLASGNCAR